MSEELTDIWKIYFQLQLVINHNAVEAHSCVYTDTRILLVKQYTTFDKYLRVGRFDPKVFVNCLQVRSVVRYGYLYSE